MHTAITQHPHNKVFIFKGGLASGGELSELLESHDFETYLLTEPKLSLEHAHSLVSLNSERRDRPYYIIASFGVMTPEAHQALLKTLEEPGEEIRFCLITPWPLLLPETIRSRALLFMNGEEGAQSGKKDFTSLPEAAQLAHIKEAFAGEGEIEARKYEALTLLDQYERLLKEKNAKDGEQLRFLYEAKKWLTEGNLSPKQVMEYVVTALRP